MQKHILLIDDHEFNTLIKINCSCGEFESLNQIPDDFEDFYKQVMVDFEKHKSEVRQ